MKVEKVFVTGRIIDGKMTYHRDDNNEMVDPFQFAHKLEATDKTYREFKGWVDIPVTEYKMVFPEGEQG